MRSVSRLESVLFDCFTFCGHGLLTPAVEDGYDRESAHIAQYQKRHENCSRAAARRADERGITAKLRGWKNKAS